MAIQRPQKKAANETFRVIGSAAVTQIDASGRRKTRMRHHNGRAVADRRSFLGSIVSGGSRRVHGGSPGGASVVINQK